MMMMAEAIAVAAVVKRRCSPLNHPRSHSPLFLLWLWLLLLLLFSRLQLSSSLMTMKPLPQEQLQ
jgi:hypothetical protein